MVWWSLVSSTAETAAGVGRRREGVERARGSGATVGPSPPFESPSGYVNLSVEVGERRWRSVPETHTADGRRAHRRTTRAARGARGPRPRCRWPEPCGRDSLSRARRRPPPGSASGAWPPRSARRQPHRWASARGCWCLREDSGGLARSAPQEQAPRYAPAKLVSLKQSEGKRERRKQTAKRGFRVKREGRKPRSQLTTAPAIDPTYLRLRSLEPSSS